MASLKRLIQSGIHFSKRAGINVASSMNSLEFSANSDRSLCSNSSRSLNGKRAFLIADTHSMVRHLEAKGVPPKEAEVMAEVLNDEAMEIVSEDLNSKDHQRSKMKHELQKLRFDIDKMRGELRYEMAKVEAEQLNLDRVRRRNRDELANHNAEATCIRASNLEQEIHELRENIRTVRYWARTIPLRAAGFALSSIIVIELVAQFCKS